MLGIVVVMFVAPFTTGPAHRRINAHKGVLGIC